jgi:L-iditol 2-dehydrogenase
VWGRVVQIGVFGKPVTLPLDEVFRKELVFTSRFASTSTPWVRTLALVEERRLELEPLVPQVVPLEDWSASSPTCGVKYVFDPL